MSKFNFFYDFGYDAFGPILLSFCRWIKNYIDENDIKKIYFLSRDGKIIKQAFDLMYGDSDIKTFYFHTSRRAIIVPSLYEIKNVNEIFEKIAFRKKIKMKSFIKKIGLEDIDLHEELEKFGLGYDYEVDIENYKSDFAFCNFCLRIMPEIRSNSLREYKQFLKYAQNADFYGKIAIVDIGWFGSMQRALTELMPNNEIHGLYVGMVPSGKILKSDKSNGFLFDCNHGSDLYKKFHYFINIFEFMFLAQEGSTKRYCNNNDGYELYEYEYSGINEPIYSEKIQQAAFEFVKNNKNNSNINLQNCTNNIIKYMLYPSYKEAKIFGNLLFLDDEKLYIAKPKKMIKYLFNHKMFIKDFKESGWRIGFLKRLIKIPLPYYKINEFLRKKILKERD